MAPATKATQKRLDAAVSSFHARYADTKQWGEERWSSSLFPALARPTIYSAVINRYSVDEEHGRELLAGSGKSNPRKVKMPNVSLQQISEENTCSPNDIVCYESSWTEHTDVEAAPSMPFPAPKPGPASVDHLLTHWNMDAASVLAASMLDVRPGDRVLDMCAAPGGKSIVLAQKLFPQLHVGSASNLSSLDAIQSSLHVNEVDKMRHKRLSANLKSYLPRCLFPTPEHPQSAVRILNKDLSSKGSVSYLPFGANSYDKVLIDAPCSSERHIIHAYVRAKASGQVAEEMLNWQSSHVITLAKVQSGLLHTALQAAKIGGTVVYATCALGFEENDGIIDKVLDTLKAERKKARKDGHAIGNWRVEFRLGTESAAPVNDPVIEKYTESTKYGRIALPDHGGWGPLYFSVMVKVAREKQLRTRTEINNADSRIDTTTTSLLKDDDPHGNP